MSRYLRKAPRTLYKPRSGHGQGMGSHSAFQALVGRSMRSVRKPDERMEFVQARGVGSVSAWQRADSSQPAVRSACACQASQPRKAPFAPHPTRTAAGATLNFSPLFQAV